MADPKEKAFPPLFPGVRMGILFWKDSPQKALSIGQIRNVILSVLPLVS